MMWFSQMEGDGKVKRPNTMMAWDIPAEIIFLERKVELGKILRWTLD
jgi:hypothetical protein